MKSETLNLSGAHHAGNRVSLNLSGALDLFEENLVDIRKACVENAIAMGKEKKPYAELTDNREDWTPEGVGAHIRWIEVNAYVTPLLTIIKRIDSRKAHLGGNRITDEDIARAKEVPLTELYEGTLRRGVGACPFHNDNTPSFNIFEDNRFKCFGCHVYGTPIDYVMLRDGHKDFIRAVRTLI